MMATNGNDSTWHPKQKGDVTTAKLLGALLQLGKTVLIPWGDNQRYDLVFEDDGKFHRIQCKTGRLVNGCVQFNACSTGNPNLPVRQHYRGQIEFFGVFIPALDKCYLVPVDDVPTQEAKLRLYPPKNNQTKGIIWAESYEI